MGKPVILLYGLTEGCGLIIPYPSGVIFCNQVGGIQCFQAKLEGVYVPLDWRGVERAMENIFDGCPITGDDADRIDAAIAANGFHGYEVRAFPRVGLGFWFLARSGPVPKNHEPGLTPLA